MNKLILKLDKRKANELNTILLNESYRRCLYWFFSYPNIPISLSDLSYNLRVSKTNARVIVLDLIEKGFLIKEEIGRVWRISVNKEHIYNKTLKIVYNLDCIYLNIQQIIQKIVMNNLNYRAIILFGSYRKGDDDESSDLDIALELVDNKELEIEEFGVINIGYRGNIKVNIHKFNRNKIDINLFNNIANGIVLEGFLEVKP